MSVVAEAKKRIVIASVLKPVNDTRMTEKLGQALADGGMFDVHVIGFPASDPVKSSVVVHTLPYFKRLTMRRALMPWRIFRHVLMLRPDLLMITTHELLCISILLRWLTGCKVVYDIQENYYNNIRYTPAFPSGIRHVLAVYVRLKEQIAAPFISHFCLAEKSYTEELPFVGKKHTVIENKVKRPSRLSGHHPRNKHQLLFTGTLAETTGVFKAIEIAVSLHQLDARYSLIIAGHCAKEADLEAIRNAIAPFPFIRLIGGNSLVPHEEIMALIQTSGSGIISYPPNKSTQGSIPTKLYEYLGLKLPIVLIDHPVWKGLCNRYQAAVVFDVHIFDAPAVLNELQSKRFYTTQPSDVYWESEIPKLTGMVVRLLA